MAEKCVYRSGERIARVALKTEWMEGGMCLTAGDLDPDTVPLAS